ncbi:rhodanese-like domain-containing protein [Desulfatitalea alkaliphila]|uniref:Rhodanese-like domain-containing protein n=1 Tax=Desulfatitalea alkaliphila TaxID=2929485 RepID=A0AA41R5D8_9BACT|nr:rhodanese-like domain-containing protein [Desulfatitalea alkaliphila]MCJ8501340.1 rhodanese-like domain-containing protein [Desulfatitalea alkaliphila]
MRFKARPSIKSIFGQTAAIVLLGALLALTFNHFRSDGIALVADWSPAGRLQAATGSDDLVIPMDQAITFHETREAVFVDARSPNEFAEGHIAGAINVPWENAFDYIEQFFAAVPDDSTVVIAYCDGEGCPLSEELVLLLRDMGYGNARVLVNGWTLWRRHGYPVE